MRHNFNIKKMEDGKTMLNLGCGYRTHWGWNNLDLSLYARLAHYKILGRLLKKAGFLSEERYQRLAGIDPGIIVWNLRKGIPFPDGVFDVVYHSHLLEHIDRDSALPFLKECHRVLKAGGIIRVVVPDLKILVDRYNSAFLQSEDGDKKALAEHQRAISDIFDQMVRRQLTGAPGQSNFLLIIERLLRGDTTKSGSSHRWMYDRHSLETVLTDAEFKDIRKADACESRISGWRHFNLDHNDNDTAYKPESIYMEGVK